MAAPNPRIVIGVCAMDKKTRSKPMLELLRRIPESEFELIIFGNDCLINKSIDEWPVVDCLIAFYSDGFPLAKAIDYADLRQPFLVNDLRAQLLLLNRHTVYTTLQNSGVPVPKYAVIEDRYHDLNLVEEYDDYIVVKGVVINKPLVEKPIDAEDHNIYIYYPMSSGGGSKRLFRKRDDRSSEFYPNENSLRQEGGPYIYEEYIQTDGNDVKVYAVGNSYAHAEVRVSPAVDGIVKRDNTSGLALRCEVELSEFERVLCRRVYDAFKQTVCGFDILRSARGDGGGGDGVVVIDVNGWSFVKSSERYCTDCARILTDIITEGVKGKGVGVGVSAGEINLQLSRSSVSDDNKDGSKDEEVDCDGGAVTTAADDLTTPVPSSIHDAITTG